MKKETQHFARTFIVHQVTEVAEIGFEFMDFSQRLELFEIVWPKGLACSMQHHAAVSCQS